MSKDAICLLIDVGLSMDGEHSYSTLQKGVSRLDLALTAVSRMIHQKLTDARKSDHVSVILFGCDDTENEMNDEDSEGFRNIKVLQGFETATLSLLRLLKTGINVGRVSDTDYFEALIVACDLMIKHTAGKKYNRKIFLFTDAAAPLSLEGVTDIKNELLQHDIVLQVIGFPHKVTDSFVESSRLALKKLAEDSGGVVLPIDSALSILSLFRSKAVKVATAFRGTFEIGSLVQIPIHVYSRSIERKLPSAKKASKNHLSGQENRSFEVETSSSHVLLDETNTSVKTEDLVKAYRYGKTLIPFDSITSNSGEIDCTKSLKLLGFVSASEIGREMSMSGVSVVVADMTDPECGSDLALSALIQAMYQKDYVALARYVRAANSNPKLVFLSPHIKCSYECLYMSVCPFSEDIRRYSFASLKCSEKNSNYNLIDSLIKKMDLTGLMDDQVGEKREAFKPKDTFNIAYQRLYNAISARALDPKGQLEPLDPSFMEHISPLPEMLKECSDIFTEIKESYHLESQTTGSGPKVRQIFGEKGIDPSLSVSKSSSSSSSSGTNPKLGDASTRLGFLDPLGDLDRILSARNESNSVAAINQLGELIMDTIEQSFGDKLYDKAMEYLKALRSSCIKVKEAEFYNNFMTNMKTKYKGSKRKADFWTVVVTQGVSLISQEESDDSKITASESKEFLIDFESSETLDVATAEAIIEPDQDLFDMLD